MNFWKAYLCPNWSKVFMSYVHLEMSFIFQEHIQQSVIWFKSLSLLYLLFISWFICSGRWCIDKLGIFHANQISLVSWSTSELMVRLAPWNKFKPSSKIFYWPFQGGTSFVDHLCYFRLVFAMLSCASVYCCLVVSCWERADLLALVCDV